MGVHLTKEQQAHVCTGRAICNDTFTLLPAGCGAMAFYQCFGGGSPVETAAVKEILTKLQASELHREFMDGVRRITKRGNGVVLSWRKKMLQLRQQFASRFLAHSLDLWICVEHNSHVGQDVFYFVYVDRAVAPSNVKQLLGWKLMWGMGCGISQEDVAPMIQQYVVQTSNTKIDDTNKSFQDAPSKNESIHLDAVTSKQPRALPQSVGADTMIPGVQPEDAFDRLCTVLARNSPSHEITVGTNIVMSSHFRGMTYTAKCRVSQLGAAHVTLEFRSAQGDGTRTWKIESDGADGSVLRAEQAWHPASWFARNIFSGYVREASTEFLRYDMQCTQQQLLQAQPRTRQVLQASWPCSYGIEAPPAYDGEGYSAPLLQTQV